MNLILEIMTSRFNHSINIDKHDNYDISNDDNNAGSDDNNHDNLKPGRFVKPATKQLKLIMIMMVMWQ